ncbi:hypothetical protein B0H67DRAFT_573554 [Lasiosphaeris hirsuta]|uniref:U4/U6.U5 small nuclear ribonucleoprotein 27kDa protein domain-containing protein n=1 Tax=Lasiosphaeris hirsuta TaxID=260670 RepID=A0AA40E1W5_9PEZI|nr:hypothetical protein B0H67DRAFT_573554 [Lasiosphaeris hirsuta]
MGDRQARTSRRGGERSFYDDSSRGDRRGGGGRDRNRDQRRTRDEDVADRDHTTRDRGDKNQGGYRKQRSRSRNRRDRRRSRSPLRERDHDRRDERTRGGTDGEARGSRRRDEARDQPRDRDRDRTDKTSHEKPRDRRLSVSPRRPSSSPRRSASPPRRGESAEQDTKLPTRPRTEAKVTTPAPPVVPLSFKVKGHGVRDSVEQQLRDGSHDSGADGHRDEDEQSRGRFDADPMDEDEEEDLVVEDDGLDAMQAMMGFGGFGTTKNHKVLGNNVGAIRKEKKTEYRQYMNRVGGFNRPLDSI